MWIIYSCFHAIVAVGIFQYLHIRKDWTMNNRGLNDSIGAGLVGFFFPISLPLWLLLWVWAKVLTPKPELPEPKGYPVVETSTYRKLKG